MSGGWQVITLSLTASLASRLLLPRGVAASQAFGLLRAEVQSFCLSGPGVAFSLPFTRLLALFQRVVVTRLSSLHAFIFL